MDKKIFCIYLAKVTGLGSEAYASLKLPASSWEVQDALDKVRLQEGEELYLEVEDYYGFEYLATYFDEQSLCLNELNDLAQRLADLDEVQTIGFEGILQERIRQNSGVITVQDLRDCAATAKGNEYHIVDAGNDAQLGRFYAENDFIPELEHISDKAFELLDFAKIGKEMRTAENGIFVGGCYVLPNGAMQAAPPCPQGLPSKPDYLFRLKLGLHPDFGGDRQTTLTLPATESELAKAQEKLGTLHWEGTVLLDYDGIIPNAVAFADLPLELEEFNEFAKAVEQIPEQHIPKLKALLEQFEVTNLADATALAEHLDEYILTKNLSSPSEAAIDYIHFATDKTTADLILQHLDLYGYGQAIIQRDNAVLSPYGLLHRTDFQPMQTPILETQKMEIELV